MQPCATKPGTTQTSTTEPRAPQTGATKPDPTGFHTPRSGRAASGTAAYRDRTSSAFRKVRRAVFLSTAAFAAGCVSPHGAAVTDVNASGWDAPAAIVFTNTDTTTLRDMDLFLRYDDRMDEDTLTVRIAVVTPDSLRHEEAFRLALPAAHTPAALSREADLPYRRRIRFARTGDYCITVTPGRPVKGVEAFGINIVKSE